MDTTRIRNLAWAARNDLRREINGSLARALAEGSRERLENASSVSSLEIEIAATSRDAVVDRVAYTWFNRFCALRYMDAKGYTPVGVVSATPGGTLPELLSDARDGVFSPDLAIGQRMRERVSGLLSGSVPSDNPMSEAYATLVVAACDHYARAMPYLFNTDNAAAGRVETLLIPRDLLSEHSVLSAIVKGMGKDECESVEVLGWLYQFYIAERKDEIFASFKRGGKAGPEDIAPATSLFTPEWIVRYMVENSLGRLWMLNRPGSCLRERMEYYIEPDATDNNFLKVGSPQDITFCDPACGSGHILVYAFDLLFSIYEEEGYIAEEIPALILEHNLTGIEIDERAAELAAFALEMKALERDPAFLSKDVDPDVNVLEKVIFNADDLRKLPLLEARSGLHEAFSHMNEVGSLYRPSPADIVAVEVCAKELEGVSTLGASALRTMVESLLDQCKLLSRTFKVVVANPPYMNSGNMNTWLSGWLKDNYPDEKSDLFAAFVKRTSELCTRGGQVGLMTPYVWMFISSYEKLRRHLVESRTLTSLIQLEYSGFAGATVPICTFTFENRHIKGYEAGFVRLSDFVGADVQAPRTLEAIANPGCGWFYRCSTEGFSRIPSSPIAYWVRNFSIFSFEKIGKNYISGGRNKTHNNELYVRKWWEIADKDRWQPYANGGEFRKWYGNHYDLVDWSELARREYASHGGLCNHKFLNTQGLCWNLITSYKNGFRIKYSDFHYSSGSPTIFSYSESEDRVKLGFLNTNVASHLIKITNPTLNTTVGDVLALPFRSGALDNTIASIVNDCISYSKSDWDLFETSWDFSGHPLICAGSTLQQGAQYTADEWQSRFDRLKADEEELNSIFIDIYGLEGEVPVEVADKDVTVHRFDLKREVKSLISYAVGCMFGRYSLEASGLILANQGETLDDYLVRVPEPSFMPDGDGIIPILDAEWFTDDVVERLNEFLRISFGEEHLSENVRFIEGALGKDLRKYMLKDFYADHVQTYQKRPIYWMFSSPKGSFNVLVYLHRYHANTVGEILGGYLRSYRDKLSSRIEVLSHGGSAAELAQADKLRAVIKELGDWERDVIYPLAQQRVEIDLDDGVRVNYNKFPYALKKVTGLSDWK